MTRRSIFALIAAVFAPKPKPAALQPVSVTPETAAKYRAAWAAVKISARFEVADIKRIEIQTRPHLEDLLKELKAAGVRPS